MIRIMEFTVVVDDLGGYIERKTQFKKRKTNKQTTRTNQIIF